ncbi:MAG TPA: SDR family oxidoreductase, partial [Longimicrobium sp.]|nr:SDR family oxidoreductase [Longimicrobium sp.]
MSGGAARVVVVTGASSGIGAELARQLGRRGDALVLAARGEEALQAVARDAGTRTHVVRADVTRRADVERLRDQALEAFGRVDAWINNAGRGIDRSVLELTEQDFDAMMAVNVKSALYGMQAIVPHFQERGTGHLVNVSSFLGRVPLAANRSAYNAAKSALNALTANLRMDLAARWPGIHVSLVMPGVVATPFARNALGAAPDVPLRGPAGMPPQTVEEATAAIVELLDHPRAELYTNPASPPIVRRYFEDVQAFEEEARRAFGAAAAP